MYLSAYDNVRPGAAAALLRSQYLSRELGQDRGALCRLSTQVRSKCDCYDQTRHVHAKSFERAQENL